MSALRNARQERFAQALALGLAPHEAYERAGYTPGLRAAAIAARLQSSTALKARIAELMAHTAGAGGAHTDPVGRAASAKTVLNRAVSHKAPADGARSNGAIAEKPARNGSEKPTSNGVTPDKGARAPSAVTAPELPAHDAATPAAPAPETSIDSLIAEFEEARQLALANKQPAAAVSATMSKARILGLVGEKGEARPGEPPSELSDLEVARRIAVLLALAMRSMPNEASH